MTVGYLSFLFFIFAESVYSQPTRIDDQSITLHVLDTAGDFVSTCEKLRSDCILFMARSHNQDGR